MAKSVLIALRLHPETKQQIDKLVETGKFKNVSDVVRKALERLLKEI